MAAKGRSSRFPSRRTSSSTLVLSLLIAFSFLILILLALGILSIPSSSRGSSTAQDLSSIVHQTVQRSDEDDGGGDQWVEVISWEPRAFIYHNFLSKDECEYLINLAKPHMHKSTVVDSTTGKSTDSRVRTSSGTFLARGRDKIVQKIEKKIADFSFIPVGNGNGNTVSESMKQISDDAVWCNDNEGDERDQLRKMATGSNLWEHGEGLQILHYEVGQKYEPHNDYFADEFNTKNGGQRIATVLMYLSDVEEGGETVFPAAKGNYSSVPWWNELSECGKGGLSVKPKMGDALLFWSMKPDASLDPSSLHGGCPVIRGNKWSSTKWMRVSEYKV